MSAFHKLHCFYKTKLDWSSMSEHRRWILSHSEILYSTSTEHFLALLSHLPRGRIQKDFHGGNHDAKIECKCVRTLVFLNAVATVAKGGGGGERGGGGRAQSAKQSHL